MRAKASIFATFMNKINSGLDCMLLDIIRQNI